MASGVKRWGDERQGTVWVKGNVFSNGVRRWCCTVLRNRFVCGVVQAVTWLEVDPAASSPWELPMVPAFVRNPFPPAWGQ